MKVTDSKHAPKHLLIFSLSTATKQADTQGLYLLGLEGAWFSVWPHTMSFSARRMRITPSHCGHIFANAPSAQICFLERKVRNQGFPTTATARRTISYREQEKPFKDIFCCNFARMLIIPKLLWDKQYPFSLSGNYFKISRGQGKYWTVATGSAKEFTQEPLKYFTW